ncbi:hypothetical protein RRG08_001151 [Elysia crispata]|uniref:PiggyBac transposable element-derived protein domain-containing protein n=1 Tax=Elysia crispata TaxID=231223 RepID=A0AAE0XWC6_9GAST|nr:hypothetical protein RRG08_001151 [Elysia crispata]
MILEPMNYETSDSNVTSPDELDVDEDVDLQTADSVTNEDEDNLDPDQGPWMPIFGNDQEPPNIPFTSHLGPRIHIERTAKPKDILGFSYHRGSCPISTMHALASSSGVCDATSHYTKYFEIYKGAHSKQDRDSEEGVTHALVVRLLTDSSLLYRGHHVGLDNYFSSFKSLLNSYVLYSEHTLDNPKISRHQLDVLESLMGRYGPSIPKMLHKRRSRQDIREACTELDPRPQPVQPPDHLYAGTIRCKLEKIGNGLRPQCQYKHSKPKRTVWQCAQCQMSLCPEFFYPYHKDNNLL